MPKQSFTPKTAKEKHEEVQALIKQIDEGVKNVFESERFKEYLKFCSSFTNYSANNTLLIAMQKPDATFVASFKKWQELGRSVDKGQHGIQILAPVAVKTGAYLETEREVTDDLGIKQYNEDGTVKTETVAEPIKELRFKKVYVFDVSQTSGKELPTLVDELTGDIDNDRKKAMLAGVQKAVQIPVEFENIRTGAKGYYDSHNQRIAINEGMSDVQTLKTAFHEAAHRFLHDKSQNTPTSKLSRDDREVQAEATAFIIANRYGIDTSEYSFPYIASWSEGKELNQLKLFLNEIQSAAREICKGIDSELLKLQKRSLSTEELIADKELTNVQKAEMLIERKINEGYSVAPDKAEKILNYAAKSDNVSEIISVIDKVAEKVTEREVDTTEVSEKAYIDKALNEIVDNYDVLYTIDDLAQLPEPDKKRIADLYNQNPFNEETGNYDIDKHLDREIYRAINLNTLKSRIVTEDMAKNGIVISDIKTKKAIGEEFYFGNPHEEMSEEDVAYDFAESITEITFINSKNESISFRNYHDMQNELRNPQGFFSRGVEKIADTNSEPPHSDIPVDNSLNERKNEYKSKDPNLFGNTSYSELEDARKFNINGKAADMIAEQLEKLGIKYIGYKKSESTIIAVSDKDVPKLKSVYEDIQRKLAREQEISATEVSEKAYIDNALNEIVKNYNVAYTIDDLAELPEPDKKRIADLYNQNPFNEETGNYDIDKQLDREIYRAINLHALKSRIITEDLAESGIAISDIKTKRVFEKDFYFGNPNEEMSDEDVAYDFDESVTEITFINSKNESISFRNYHDMQNELRNPQGFFSHGVEKIANVNSEPPHSDIPVDDSQVLYPVPNTYQPLTQPVEPAKEQRKKNEETKPEDKKGEKKSSLVIGNTPYDMLGAKSELKYFHATPEMTDKIAAQLEEDGIKFSGLKRSSGTTFTVNKADAERYSQAVAKINAENSLNERKNEYKPKDPNLFGNTPYAELENARKFNIKGKAADMIAEYLEKSGIKYTGYKKSDTTIIAVSDKDVPKLKSAYEDIQRKFVCEACREFISAGINKAFENRAVREFVKEIEDKFGIDNAMYVLGKSISDNPSMYPKQITASAKKIKYPENSTLKSFDNIQPSLIGALYNDLATRQRELNPPVEPSKSESELNAYFNDKHLLSMDRKHLEADENGFPITKHENTSANEYYVQGYGWLDNDELERARKEYPHPQKFGKLITKVNINYVDDNGHTGCADIDYSEYKLFTDITYAKENEERYEAAKGKMKERLEKAAAAKKPTEYYAISRISENRYNIVTIGTDDTPDIVKQGLSKEDAISAIKKIYNDREKSGINCEIISNSDLTKICSERYIEQVEAAKKQSEVHYMPYDISFSDRKLAVLPNPKPDYKNPDATSHYVQSYIKDGDKYKAVGVAMVGTYDECRAFTDKAKATGAIPPPQCEIYQLKSGEENHDVRFAGSEELIKMGKCPDFSRYELKYSMPMSELPEAKSCSQQLEMIYQKFNNDRPSDFTGHSLSVSDVVVFGKKPFFVDSAGFKSLRNFLPEQIIETYQKEFLENLEQRVSAAKTPADLKAIEAEAKKLGFDFEIKSDDTEQQNKKNQPIKPNKPMKRGH